MDQVAEAGIMQPPPWVTRRRLDVHEYHRMGEAGILHEDDRIELIEGELVEMQAVGGPHIAAVMALTELLAEVVRKRARISVQNPVRLGRYNEPQPDVALVRLRADRYRGGPPLVEDVLLLVEVSDSTLRYDRGVKLPLYARHGIPEVWVVDLQDGVVEVCRGPTGDGYAEVVRAGRDAVLELPGLPGARVRVEEVLG